MTVWLEIPAVTLPEDCFLLLECSYWWAWSLFSALQLCNPFLSLEHLCFPVQWQGPWEWGAFCKWGYAKTLWFMTIIAQSCPNSFAQLILMASTVIWEEKQNLSLQLNLYWISFLHAWTKLLILVLQEFREGNQQYHCLVYRPFQAINMTFSKLKITSSINDQSGLSKKKRVLTENLWRHQPINTH